MEMRSLEVIDRDIERVKKELGSVRGSETEVYARIVGYYRSVRNWNKGKKDEFKHRKEFVMSNDSPAYAITEADTQSCCGAARLSRTKESPRFGAPSRYEFYSRKTCPNCPSVRDYLDSCALSGTLIDVDTPDGIQRAATNGVFAAPTVIMYDDKGNEVIRAHNKTELASVMAAAS
jgi:ribonucleoside-triphosphate reductase